MPSAARSPAAEAANPIAGGPARNPNQPIVETAATPALAETVAVEAAARNSTGTTTPRPAPIAANPAIATGTEPMASARPSPTVAATAPERASVTGPRRRLRRSPTVLLAVIASEKAVYASAAMPAAAPNECER